MLRSGSIEIMPIPRAPLLKLLKWLPTAHMINFKCFWWCKSPTCSSHWPLRYLSAPTAKASLQLNCQGCLSLGSSCMLLSPPGTVLPAHGPDNPCSYSDCSLIDPHQSCPWISNQVTSSSYRFPEQSSVLLGTLVIMYIFVMVFLLPATQRGGMPGACPPGSNA